MKGPDFSQDDDAKIVSEINVTPLVDIMLVLLIIFMLVSTFVAKEAIEVDLPHAATGKETERKTLSVLVSQAGDYYLSGRKYETVEDLGTQIKTEKEGGKDLQVVISADRKVNHGKVVDIIDLVRQLEIYDFAINVEYDEEAFKQIQ